MKHLSLSLFAALCMLPVAAQAQGFTPEQKQEIEAMIKDYILNNGGDIIQSVNTYQTKQEEEANKLAEAKAAELAEKLKNNKDIASVGNPKGDVLVVEFFDYNCGYCKKAFSEVQTLLKDDKNVRLVLYDMPILGPSSHTASKWALAAKKQNKYWDFHQAIMMHEGSLDDETLENISEEVGLDVAKLRKDIEDPAIEEEIQSHLATARELGIQGTPGFLVGTQVFRGYIPYDQMKAAIAETRSAKKD